MDRDFDARRWTSRVFNDVENGCGGLELYATLTYVTEPGGEGKSEPELAAKVTYFDADGSWWVETFMSVPWQILEPLVEEAKRSEEGAMPRSPRIIHLSWGRMEVEGVGTGRDFKLWPGGGRPWDWKETNTHHVPGIQPADVQELLEKGSKVVVLTRGMELALQTCPETLRLLEERGVKWYVEETKKAVELYNQLRETKVVGGLFHSTC